MEQFNFITITRRTKDFTPRTFEEMIDQVLALKLQWAQEDGQGDSLAIEYERELLMQIFDTRSKGCIILAQNNETGEYVGFGKTYLKDTRIATFMLSYVIPEARRNGIFGEFTRQVIEHNQQIGVEQIVASPIPGAFSEEGLLKYGFVVTSEDTDIHGEIHKELTYFIPKSDKEHQPFDGQPPFRERR